MEPVQGSSLLGERVGSPELENLHEFWEGHGLRKPIDPWEKWQHRTSSVFPIRHNWACICRTLTKIYPKISRTSHDRVTGTYLTNPLSINWSKYTMTRGLPGIKPDKNIWAFVFGCWTMGRKWGEHHSTLSSLPEGILWTMVQWEGAHTPLAHCQWRQRTEFKAAKASWTL